MELKYILVKQLIKVVIKKRVQRKMFKIMNDTRKTMRLRVHHKGAMPAVVDVEPQGTKAIFNMKNDVFIKVWDNNTVLIQELDTCNKTDTEKEQ